MQAATNDHSIPQDNHHQIASSLSTETPINEEGLSGPGGPQGSNGALLRAEANADFKSLQGYWNRIIVKDMASKTSFELPDVLIS